MGHAKTSPERRTANDAGAQDEQRTWCQQNCPLVKAAGLTGKCESNRQSMLHICISHCLVTLELEQVDLGTIAETR